MTRHGCPSSMMTWPRRMSVAFMGPTEPRTRGTAHGRGRKISTVLRFSVGARPKSPPEDKPDDTEVNGSAAARRSHHGAASGAPADLATRLQLLPSLEGAAR